ncbi:MAG: cytochrome C oxidase subunit IV family protein [Bdellovibrionales bacterium]|nr:cytochrome C oxidase subunit IV family protein [Bdellovibrionales bacterium]
MGSSHSHGHQQDGAHPSEHHVAPFAMYMKVFWALIALTVVTVFTAKFVHFGSHTANIVVAMVIALVKATLVVLFFMHQKYETQINRLVFGAAFGTLVLLIFFVAVDLNTRITFTQDPGALGIKLHSSDPAAAAHPGSPVTPLKPIVEEPAAAAPAQHH